MRRRVLADVHAAGGWPVVLARIASGEQVAEIARSFACSRSFFSRLLHEDRDRHALVVEARWRAEGEELLIEAVEMIGGFSRPDARRLRVILGERAAVLDGGTLATLDRLRFALRDGGGEPSDPALRAWREQWREVGEEDLERLGELFIASARGQSRQPPSADHVAVLPEMSGAATLKVP